MLSPHFSTLHREYIFPIIERKLAELQKKSLNITPLNLGIGDIARPLAPSIAHAIIEAVEEMTRDTSIRGYGPHNGYLFLREAIAAHDFAGLEIDPSEIFISDGINSDAVNIQDLFDTSCTVGILDPTYPAYKDATLLSGKKNIVMIPCKEENHFSPLPPTTHCDLLYLCSPNNPTGAAMTRGELQKWIDYALKEEAIILFDHAYQSFITSSDVPKSIFELPGAKECAIEFRSFSKGAGFTGLRCAYTVLPKTVKGRMGQDKIPLHGLWDRRQAAKFNGVAYPIQKGALATYSAVGKQETQAQVQGYLAEALKLKQGLEALGMTCYGGIDSPYVFWKTQGNLSSWEFFDLLLEKCHLISVPGSGFGKEGEGFIRLSAFILPETTTLALERLKHL